MEIRKRSSHQTEIGSWENVSHITPKLLRRYFWLWNPRTNFHAQTFIAAKVKRSSEDDPPMFLLSIPTHHHTIIDRHWSIPLLWVHFVGETPLFSHFHHSLSHCFRTETNFKENKDLNGVRTTPRCAPGAFFDFPFAWWGQSEYVVFFFWKITFFISNFVSSWEENPNSSSRSNLSWWIAQRWEWNERKSPV